MATVAATEVDCVPANNSAGVRVTVQAQIANLSITKTGTASVAVGGTVTWTLSVTNGGPNKATGVTVSDPIPAGMTLTSATTTWPGGSCTGNPLVTCSLGTMINAATATITILAVNNGTATKSNTASVTSSSATDFDPDTTNNSATAITTVTGAAAPLCANPGQQGAGGSLSGVVNTYYPGTANATAGVANTCIPVGTPTGAAAIATGNLLLVIQMQDADINPTNDINYGGNNGTGAGATTVNAGKYEFVVARGAVGAAGCGANTVGITGSGTNSGLLNSYTNANATATKGQMRFQVVRVPQYTTATANGITALPWVTNTAAPIGLGTGGILAIDVAGALTLNSGVAIGADGDGFRGGAGRQLGGGAGANTDWRTASTVTTNGSKGEGIAGTPEWVQAAAPLQTNQPNDGYPNGSMARGAPANAGGGSTDGNPAANDENSGGGGGSNGGAGGKGGFTWNSQLDSGGTGAAVTPAVTKLVLGGGGGGGTRNNNPGDNLASGGAAGGGLDRHSGGATLDRDDSHHQRQRSRRLRRDLERRRRRRRRGRKRHRHGHQRRHDRPDDPGPRRQGGLGLEDRTPRRPFRPPSTSGSPPTARAAAAAAVSSSTPARPCSRRSTWPAGRTASRRRRSTRSARSPAVSARSSSRARASFRAPAPARTAPPIPASV